MKDRFILACQEYFVKRRAEAQAAGQPVCAHPRFRRETLPEEDISRRLKRLGRRIVRSEGLNKPVRVPALNGAEWGICSALWRPSKVLRNDYRPARGGI